MGGVAIRARGLRKYFDGGLVRAIDDVDFDVEPTQTVAITGPTGCGKSTLLSLLALLDEPDAGTLTLDGAASTLIRPAERWRARTLGLVFQFHHLLPHLTAEENIALPLVGLGLGRGERQRRAEEMLASVGLQHRRRALAATLSGGERQLVAVGRALVNRPALLLADEPTGSVDSQTGKRILDLVMCAGAESGATVIVVTHDREVAELAPRQLRMLDGRIVDGTR